MFGINQLSLLSHLALNEENLSCFDFIFPLADKCHPGGFLFFALNNPAFSGLPR